MLHWLPDGAFRAPARRDDERGIAAARGTAHPRLILVTTILASSLAFIDGSVTNVALPAIGRSFKSGATEFPWIINAYLLPLAALLLLGGAAGDRFGQRRVLELGIVVFAVASAGCAFSLGILMFLTCRALQGAGAALLTPASLAALGAAFQGEDRGRAVGTWAAAGAIAGAVGPPVGGWLVEAVGWRSIFFINLPLGSLAIVLARRSLPSGAEGGAQLDWAGGACATAALGLLTWSLTAWSNGHGSSLAALSSVAAGGALVGVFWLIERRKGDLAMMPLSLFSSRTFVGLNAATLLLYGALGGAIILLPFVLIMGAGWSATAAGLSLLPFSLIVGLGSRMAGRLSERSGPRLPLTLGPSMAAAGLLLLARADPDQGYVKSFLPGLTVMAIGMAAAVAPLTSAVLSTASGRLEGTAAGFNSAVARLGGLLATALAAVVMTRRGAGLISAFHYACATAAAVSILAAASAFYTLAGSRRAGPGS